MAVNQPALVELLEMRKGRGCADPMQVAAQNVYRALINTGRWERTHARIARVLSTTAGELGLRILKLRTGSFFPSLLERRQRINQWSVNAD